MGKIRLSPTRVTPTLDESIGMVGRIRVAEEIVATYFLARWWLRRLTFEEAVARARRVPFRQPPLLEPELTHAGVRLGSAVQRTLRALPLDARCLITALVLTRMLARRGITSSFVLGVRMQPAFAAHAWVERENTPLLPTMPNFRPLTVL